LLLLIQRNGFVTTEIKRIHIEINALLTCTIINSVHNHNNFIIFKNVNCLQT